MVRKSRRGSVLRTYFGVDVTVRSFFYGQPFKGGDMNEEAKVVKILETPLKEKGYDIASLRFVSGQEPRLEIVVDRVEPIGLDDIVELCGFVSNLLDEADPIEAAYTLDLSSAGAEKKIDVEKLPSYVGRFVHLHLSHPFKGENILEGTLLSMGEETVLLVKDKSKKKEIRFPTNTIDGARLAIEF